jgi:hypothetical protein
VCNALAAHTALKYKVVPPACSFDCRALLKYKVVPPAYSFDCRVKHGIVCTHVQLQQGDFSVAKSNILSQSILPRGLVNLTQCC